MFEDDASWLSLVEAAADFPRKIEANPAPKKPFKNLGRERFSLLSAMNGGEKRLYGRLQKLRYRMCAISHGNNFF